MARVPFVLALASLYAPLAAQTAGAPTADAQLDPRVALQKACQKMAWLQGLEFTSVESQDSALARKLGRGLGDGDVEVSAQWTPETVQVEIGEADQVVVHRGRAIARDDDHDWALRKDRLAGGGKRPFVFDPAAFFEVLQRLPNDAVEIARDETIEQGDGPCRVITITLEADAAHELVRAGALPSAEGAGGIAVRIAGGIGQQFPDPDLLTDIALYLDPVSHLVERIRVKSYQDSGFGGNVMFQVQGAGIQLGNRAAEQPKVEELDAGGARRFAEGLPVRKVDDDQTALSFTVRFAKHDMPIVPDLDETAKRLLRMR